MSFLLTPVGTLGDLNPYLGLGRELKDRGHRVAIVTTPSHLAMVNNAGLEFVPVDTVRKFKDFQHNPDIWHRTRGWKLALKWGAVGQMRQLYQIIADRYVPGQTVVVGPGMAFGARIAQERLGVPFATLHLEPDKFRSCHHSPLMPPPLVLDDWVPRISKRCQLWVADTFFVDPLIAPQVNAFRAELGLSPVRRLVDRWWHSSQRVIGMFPGWYCRPQPDWPRQAVLTGFPLWDIQSASPVPRDVARFLDEGEPPIVFTLGSENPHVERFFEAAVQCCQLLGRRGLLVTKHRERLPSPLPDGVRCFDYVPFNWLLPRVAAIVHHAGIGTVALALAAGIPQLAVPLSFNQPDDAARVVRLGVGASITPSRLQGPALARKLGRLLSSPETLARCREMAARLHDNHAIEDTCDLLEDLLGSDLPPTTRSDKRVQRVLVHA